MKTANCSTSYKSYFDAAADMLELYSYFFPVVKHLAAVADGKLAFHERSFRDSVFQNFHELEGEYQDNLMISFGESKKIKPLRALIRPKLKYQITLLNAWNHMFDAFGSVEVFMAGLGVRVIDTRSFNQYDLCLAKSRILSALRRLYEDCRSFLGGYMGNNLVLEHASAIVRRLDVNRVFE
ncbi:hypothetical protein [Pseudomonas putida]|uniref:hypothetical protein n=1 Tax=Pseudomonas putida TaxID=303 RepID=UPI0009020382|nr:hypothetical protein [Pseudomonas putida]APE97091.1 hypothetical protein BG030_02985 [Pseudomonas putida]